MDEQPFAASPELWAIHRFSNHRQDSLAAVVIWRANLRVSPRTCEPRRGSDGASPSRRVYNTWEDANGGRTLRVSPRTREPPPPRLGRSLALQKSLQHMGTRKWRANLRVSLRTCEPRQTRLL